MARYSTNSLASSRRSDPMINYELRPIDLLAEPEREKRMKSKIKQMPKVDK